MVADSSNYLVHERCRLVAVAGLALELCTEFDLVLDDGEAVGSDVSSDLRVRLANQAFRHSALKARPCSLLAQGQRYTSDCWVSATLGRARHGRCIVVAAPHRIYHHILMDEAVPVVGRGLAGSVMQGVHRMVSVEVGEVADSTSTSSQTFQAQEVAVVLVEVPHLTLTVVKAAEAGLVWRLRVVPVQIRLGQWKQTQADWISTTGRISMVVSFKLPSPAMAGRF